MESFMSHIRVITIPPTADRKSQAYRCPEGLPDAMFYWGSDPVPDDLTPADLVFPRAVPMDRDHDWSWKASSSSFRYSYSDGPVDSHTAPTYVVLVYGTDHDSYTMSTCDSCGETCPSHARFCPWCGSQISS